MNLAEQIGEETNKFERRMMMAEYNEKIKKAKQEGNEKLADELFKECFKKAKKMGWKI